MTKRTFIKVLLVGAGLCLLLAFIGFLMIEKPGPQQIINAAWRTLALLVMQSQETDGLNGPVAIARLLLSIAAIWTLGELALQAVSKWRNFDRFAEGTYSTVIIGATKEARSFARNSADACVLLDPSCPVTLQPPAAAEVHQVPLSVDEEGALETRGIGNARSIRIMGDDDSTNLATLGKILAKRLAGAQPLHVAVRIQNRELAQRLELDPDFVLPRLRAQPPGSGLEVTPFRADAIAARLFLTQHPLVDLAELRGQPRIHLVIVGWTAFAFDVIEQLARLSPYGAFGQPRADLFVPDPEAVRAAFAAVQPVFRDVESPPGPPGSVEPMEIHLHKVDALSHIPNHDQIVALEQHSPSVTATLVTLGTDASSVATALALRESLAAVQRWQGPLFVKVEDTTPLTESLAARARKAEEAERIVPIGSLDEVCGFEQLAGKREAMAQLIHKAYLRSTEADKKPLDKRNPNEVEWERLAPVYRQANRRAADHMPIKLRSTGFVLGDAPHRICQGEILDDPPGELDHLAELEHRSWEIDLVLKGWRGGRERDRQARINEYIGIPYRELEPGVKNRDLDQVRLLEALLKDGLGPVSRREFRVAAVGHNDIPEADSTRIATAFDPRLQDLLDRHEDRFVSILTPLAPGADLVLTQAIVRRLREKERSHRIVLVRALPPAVVVREYAKEFDQPTAEAQGRLDAFLREMRENDTPVVVANLQPVGTIMEDWQHAENRVRAFRLANSYLGTRCDAMAVYLTRTEAKPGGTAEAVAWAEHPESIPREFQFPARRRPVVPEIVQLP